MPEYDDGGRRTKFIFLGIVLPIVVQAVVVMFLQAIRNHQPIDVRPLEYISFVIVSGAAFIILTQRCTRACKVLVALAYFPGMLSIFYFESLWLPFVFAGML